VYVSRDAFTFVMGDARVQLPTYLYLRQDPDAFRVAAVGEEPPRSPNLVRVDLFGEAKRLGQGKERISNMECLEAFVRYAIQKLRRTLVRPTVTITGIVNLDPVLHGYQTAVLRHVFESAGAIEVIFDESFAV
jgi:hypothetical protein